MKKLKLFISLWFTMFSMVVFGQAEYEKIAITANTQDNSALKVNVQSSSNEINWKYIKDFQKEKEYLSTGLIKSGVISINGDNTKYNVSAGIGIITNFDDPENPTSTIVNFPAVVAKTPSYLTTSNITYVAINSSGTVTESATPFTPEQRRTLIILGAVIHSNLTNINVVNNISAPTNASTNQLHDLMEAIGALNLSGNKFGPNNANLLMNKSAGTIFKLGSNFVNDWKNPHVLGQSALTGLTFRYRTQNGTEGSDVTSITPNVYDLNNVLTTVPNGNYTIQTITLFQTGLVRIQYGQETYNSLSEAEAAISTRSYNVESNIALNGITRAYLLVKKNTTSLLNSADAKFVDAGKFGSITSGGGAITFASIIAALGYTPENNANKQNSLATDGSGVKYPTVDAVNTKVSNIDNTSDLNKPISTATQTALNLKENTANKNIANGYAGLGSDGKLISSQLPSITITDTFVVGSQSAMLSLVAETGDVSVRTDVNKSFILQGDTPSDLADWQELLTPTSTVSSVFGRTGAVTSNSGDYTADQISETASRKFQTLEQKTYNDATSSIQTQLNAKENLSNKSTSTTLGTSDSLYPTQNAVKVYVDGKIGGGDFANVVYVNSTDPATATIFDLSNPPVTNNDALKTDVGNLYVATNNSTWTYKTSPAGYFTYTVSSTSSNFYLTGTTVDAGSNKTSEIQRAGALKATAFKTTNGTASQFVKGDGTLDSAVYAKIQMSQGYVPSYNSAANTFGNSNIYDNGTSVLIGSTGTAGAKLSIIESTTTRGGILLQNTNTSSTSNLFQMSLRGTGKLIDASDATSTMFSVSNSGGGYFRGNTGIGTATPTRILEVVGTTPISHKHPSSPNEMIIGQFDSSGNSVINNVSNSNLYFHTNNSRVMSLLSGGNVGIGTSTPAVKFHSYGSALTVGDESSYSARFSNNSNKGVVIGYDSTNNKGHIGSINPGVAWTDLILNANGGNVGIGTTSPGYKLEVSGTTDGVIGIRNTTNNSFRGLSFLDGSGATEYSYIKYNANTGEMRHWSNPSGFGGFTSFYSNNAESMRITSGGEVLVGKTAVDYTVAGSQFESNGKRLGITTNTSTSTMFLNRRNSQTGEFISFFYNDGPVGSISTNGTVTAYNVTSDYRLKQDFKPFNGLDLVSKIKVYDYEWKADNSRMNGVIAHELQEVVPYAVTGEKDGKNMQQVDYSKLVPILIQSIQELKAEIELLKNK